MAVKEAEATDAAADETSGRGIRPPHVVIGFGVAVAAFMALSGVASAVFGFEDDSEIHRKVFGNIPNELKVAFYTIIPILIIVGAIQFANRVKNWQRGAPENRKTTSKNVKRRLGDFRAGVYMQTLLRDKGAGLMHSMIYFGFLVLLGVTTTLEVDHQLPESLKFLHGGVYKGYSAVGDAAGVIFTVGILWAMARRYGPRSMRPYRIRIKNKPEHLVILLTFLAIGITGFAAEAFRIALDGSPDYEKWSFIGYPLAQMVDGMDSLAGWHQVWWIAHVFAFIVFLIILPITMLRHMFTSPLNMYLSDRDRPKGAMKPMPNLMETELETFGASTIEDFTWKQLLDTDSCTMCGRCTAVCPAHATGKSLDPREIVLKTGEVMAATGTPKVSPPIGTDGDITIGANSIFERVTSEEVWACTSCKACDEICPVNIEILDKILDMRRYLSLMESDFPTELGNAYRAMENQGNPWGMSQGDRADWIGELEGIEVLDGSDPMAAEYLYWVGCAGSFDDKNRKVSQAFSQLMQRAGLTFAVLGPSEMCTGDPARRSGNEYIFQMLAMQNIETLDAMGVKKIVTQCPHCFNTLANEYPQLGGHYEVIHHSQLLEVLIDDGRLDVSNAKLEDRLVYHDSCYLGRHNDVYVAPRKVVGSIGGLEVVEAGRNGTQGMCCGAGGARMWMEEHVGKQVNVERSQELLATGANRIATACPFCYIMIDDGIKGEGVEEDEVKVADIAMHVLEAIEAGEQEDLDEVMTPISERVTQDVLQDTLGYGLPRDDDGELIEDPSPIATLVAERRTAEPVPAAAIATAAVEPLVEESPATNGSGAVVAAGAAAAGAVVAGAAVAGATSAETEAASESAADSTASTAAGTQRADNLALIRGTDPQIVGLLNAQGITGFDQIAALDDNAVLELEQTLNINGRIRKWNWVGQAQLFLDSADG